MKKMFKKFLESKGYTAETFKSLEAEKQADLQNEYLGTLETQIEALKGNATEIEALKTTSPDSSGPSFSTMISNACISIFSMFTSYTASLNFILT